MTKPCPNRLIQTILLLSLASQLQAQSFKITVIDLYGNRHVAAAAIRTAIRLKEGDSGDPQTFQREAILSRLRAIPGVTDAALSPVCCDDRENGLMIYVTGHRRGGDCLYDEQTASSARPARGHPRQR